VEETGEPGENHWKNRKSLSKTSDALQRPIIMDVMFRVG